MHTMSVRVVDLRFDLRIRNTKKIMSNQKNCFRRVKDFFCLRFRTRALVRNERWRIEINLDVELFHFVYSFTEARPISSSACLEATLARLDSA